MTTCHAAIAARNAPEARKTTPDEIARVTGWDIKAVHAAIQAGEVPGCRFIPPQRYLCAWMPFHRWWFEGIEPAAAPKDETHRFIHRMQTLDTIHELIECEAVS